MNSNRLICYRLGCLGLVFISGMHFPQLIYATSIQSSETNIKIDTIGSEPFFGEDPDTVKKEYEDAQKAEEAKKAAEAAKIQTEPGQAVEVQPAPGQAVQVQTPPSGAPAQPVPSTPSKSGESNESKQKGSEKGINYGY